MPTNVRITVEYDGEPFHGWQRQRSQLPTIQGEIERCLSEIVGSRVVIYGAGRTDSGVHARAQEANFYVDFPIPPERWALALNTKLPFSIRIIRSQEAPPQFHAQKSAVGKIYEYRILNRSFSSALDRRVYFYPQPLDWDMIRQVLPVFVGEHDFKAFQSAGTPTVSTIRRIDRFELTEAGQGVYCFTIEGNGFLKQMVRNIVGTVVEVGQRIRDPRGVAELFATRDRVCVGRAVPARGLCLVEVIY